MRSIVFAELVRLYRGTASGDRQPLVVVVGQFGGSDLRGLSLARGPPLLDFYNALISKRLFFVMDLFVFLFGAEAASLVMFACLAGIVLNRNGQLSCAEPKRRDYFFGAAICPAGFVLDRGGQLSCVELSRRGYSSRHELAWSWR